MVRKNKLFVDFDSTLVNSCDVVIGIFNRMFSTNYTIDQLKKRNFSDLFKTVTPRLIHKVFDSDEFYSNLKFKEDSYNILSKYCEFYDIQLVTKVCRDSLSKKAEWISKNIDRRVIPNIIFIDTNSSKGVIDMRNGILVDDFVENTRETNAMIKILYSPYPSMEDCHIDNLDEVYKVSTWDEIDSILEFYRKQGKII